MDHFENELGLSLEQIVLKIITVACVAGPWK